MAELTNERLVKLIQEGGTDRNKNLEILWSRNLNLVRLIIKKLTGYRGNEDIFQDMEQQAFIGFYDAVMRFDESKNIKFFSFANDYIRKSIYRYYDNGGYSIRIPEYMRGRIKRYYNIKAKIEAENKGGRVEPVEVLKNMGLKENAIKYTLKAIQNMEQVSLDEYLKEDDKESGNLLDMIAGSEDVEVVGIESVYLKELHEALKRAIGTLPKNTEKIITAVYFQKFSMSHIADINGCTKANISQSIKKGFQIIRTGKHAAELLEFLPEGAVNRAEKKIVNDFKELSEQERGLLI